MLRITVLHEARGTTFKMEGKLTHEWVAEAERSWTAFSNIPRNECVVVDLCGVSFVDNPGRELLARMHSSGAKLIGTGPMTSALIEEICAEKRPPSRKWIRSALSLFFLLLLATLIPGNKGPFNYRLNHRRISFSEYASSAIQERIVPIHRSVRYGSVASEKSRAIPLRKGLSR